MTIPYADPYRDYSKPEELLPDWETLTALDSLSESTFHDLRIDTGDFRVWTSRANLADGEPYPHTVYVETRTENADRSRELWQALGHYDGDAPPRGLPGLTPHALRGET